MIRPLSTLLAMVLAAGAASTTLAAQPTREELRERVQNMTPEQKAAAREKARARWESMTPEQRAAAKQRFAERHPDAARRLKDRGQAMPPAGAVPARPATPASASN